MAACSRSLNGGFVAILLFLSVQSSLSADPARIRDDEIRQCHAGDLMTWDDGRDAPAPRRQMFFAYDPTGAPVDFPHAAVVAMIRRALDAWAACGLQLDWAE